ncbi:hypothetical protein SAY86_001181 [Trapa natans]|uniref:non-specific serine/threonine protein kinase n=1 Tax=Trapa natans TaxID=22666 RepID=A0AAN7M540_TRANT|nr:hypothetical protein SAY86_001181 [Trapa natans]
MEMGTLPCHLLLLFSCSLSFPLLAVSQLNSKQEFIFNGFNHTNQLLLDGASLIKNSGALKLTNRSKYDMGRAFYKDAFQMIDPANRSAVSSFSTNFVFAIKPQIPGQVDAGGYGLAFVVAPTTEFPGAEAEHYLGLFNSSTDKDPSNHMLVIEFDTVNGYGDDVERVGNHVGVNVNGMNSIKTEPAAYFTANNVKEDMTLERGEPIQAWIEYDAKTKLVNVTISPFNITKPLQPLISVNVAPDDVFIESMFVGFSASTGRNIGSLHYVLGWSFAMNGPAPSLNLSQLPLPPPEKAGSSSLRPEIVALIVSLCAIGLCLLGFFICFTVVRRKMRSQQGHFEDWELDCPHRFLYKDLHAATKGFRESEKIGVGGFGSVYRGVLLANQCEVAVKKIARKEDSMQGMREFVAEVESLGRLRHKNLVNLQGWCKHKNDLLLVYDYIPNGSLYSLLFDRGRLGIVLSWDHRFHILKGIAAGLLYLHEEWEQVVIHRDVKSSNVLIDAEMNARLGDFGLARLYDHSQMSHTTKIVGTLGYIAPELARAGKASKCSDVFAYGIILLEVATGRRPLGSGDFILADWVAECHGSGRILDAVDLKLGSVYAVEEVKLVLQLGLLCSHPSAKSRPTMRHVVRYLNRDDPLPALDVLELASGSRQTHSLDAKFLTVFTLDSSSTWSKSNLSSSVGTFSSGSLRR